MEADELKEARERLGMTPAQLGDALGVGRSTIWRWEQAKRPIPPYLPLALETLEMRQDPSTATNP